MCGFGVGGGREFVARNISGCECACGQREIDTTSSEKFKTREKTTSGGKKRKPKECCYQQARIKELVYKQNAETKIAPNGITYKKKAGVWNFERAH